MSKPQKFHEYLGAKGGGKKDDAGEKPKVTKVADYPGPHNNNPPQGGSGYTAQGSKTPKGQATDDPKNGFAAKGDKKLVYEPKTENSYERERVKTKTQEWLDNTKKLSLSEFAQEIKSSAIVEGKSPTDNIRRTVANCQLNPNLIETVLREFKRAELLEDMVAQLFQHPEAYKELAKLMEGSEDGVVVCRRLVRAVNEIVGPPAHDLDDEMGPKPKPKLGMGDEDMDDMGDEDMDIGDEDMGDEDMEDEDMDDMGDEDMDDMGDEGMDDMGDEGMDDMGDEGMDDMGDEGMGMGMGKMKKHSNMLDAMKMMRR